MTVYVLDSLLDPVRKSIRPNANDRVFFVGLQQSVRTEAFVCFVDKREI
jgi:hypothetical protein